MSLFSAIFSRFRVCILAKRNAQQLHDICLERHDLFEATQKCSNATDFLYRRRFERSLRD